MKQEPSYPKTYAKIIDINIQARRMDHGGIWEYPKSFTPEEWEKEKYRNTRRRYYFLKTITKVQINNTDEILELNDNELRYHGKEYHRIVVGATIKMFKHPRSRSEWCFRITGE